MDPHRLNAIFTFLKVRRKSKFAQIGIQLLCGHPCMYIQGSPFEIQTPKHWNWICPSVTAPAACVIIAQQYSSATFISINFHSLKEKFCLHFKNVIIS